MVQKIALVTGASSGIGLETARGLAQAGCRVVMACRNMDKAVPLAEEINAENNAGSTEVMELDLASFKAVCDFARAFKVKYKKLDILINNGGVFRDSLGYSADGYEMTMAVNYLGHYLLTKLLLPSLLAAGTGRIINITSKAGLHGKLEPGDNIFKGKAAGFRAYSASKLAQILSTIELAEELGKSRITVNAAYPGRVATNIWQGGGLMTNLVAKLMMRSSVSPAEGAKTGLYLALSPAVSEVSGKLFFEDQVIDYRKVCFDQKLRKALIEASEKAVENAC